VEYAGARLKALLIGEQLTIDKLQATTTTSTKGDDDVLMDQFQ